MKYLVIVKRLGQEVGQHNVEAPDSLAAMNFVEQHYGNRPEVNITKVGGHNTFVVAGWHGHCFEARRLT